MKNRMFFRTTIWDGFERVLGWFWASKNLDFPIFCGELATSISKLLFGNHRADFLGLSQILFGDHKGNFPKYPGVLFGSHKGDFLECSEKNHQML